ncbi:DUF1427 family protein [Streptomyces sp. NPDC087859]|uniref:DUF1427 family protein n=1 Tax=Streptomyces sp. NPDC087859 TaxID=3365812 RepID=UPI0037F12517
MTETMLAYSQALAAGALVGAVYALLRVRSPAPPLYGLAGLAGMLLGHTVLSALL